MMPFAAKKLAKDDAADIPPTERATWLDDWRHIHERLADVNKVQFLTFWSGPECWLVRDPRLLAETIPADGRLNLWKMPVASDRLEFVE